MMDMVALPARLWVQYLSSDKGDLKVSIDEQIFLMFERQFQKKACEKRDDSLPYMRNLPSIIYKETIQWNCVGKYKNCC